MIGARSSRISPLRPHGRRSRHRVSVRAFWRSAPGSRRSSSERVPPRARRTGRTWKPLRMSAPRTCRKALSLSLRRRAPALQRASPPGMYRRRRRRQGGALHKTCKAPPRGVRAFASCFSHAPSGVGPRGSSPRMVRPRPSAWRSGRARRPVLSRCRARRPCAREREDVARTVGTGPVRAGRRCVVGSARVHIYGFLHGLYGALCGLLPGWLEYRRATDGGTSPQRRNIWPQMT